MTSILISADKTSITITDIPSVQLMTMLYEELIMTLDEWENFKPGEKKEVKNERLPSKKKFE